MLLIRCRVLIWVSFLLGDLFSTLLEAYFFFFLAPFHVFWNITVMSTWVCSSPVCFAGHLVAGLFQSEDSCSSPLRNDCFISLLIFSPIFSLSSYSRPCISWALDLLDDCLCLFIFSHIFHVRTFLFCSLGHFLEFIFQFTFFVLAVTLNFWALLFSKGAFFIASFSLMDAVSSVHVCLIELYWSLGDNRW